MSCLISVGRSRNRNVLVFVFFFGQISVDFCCLARGIAMVDQVALMLVVDREKSQIRLRVVAILAMVARL